MVRRGFGAIRSVAAAVALDRARVSVRWAGSGSINAKEFARFKPLDVIASMQLYWAAADELSIDLLQPYISAMQFQFMYPARSLLKNGATIAGASDWPVSTPEPWKAIAQAISRKGPKGVLNKDEGIDRETMFYAYTRAWSSRSAAWPRASRPI